MTAPPKEPPQTRSSTYDPVVIKFPAIRLPRPRMPQRREPTPEVRHELVYTYVEGGRILQHLVPIPDILANLDPRCRSAPDTWAPAILGATLGTIGVMAATIPAVWWLFTWFFGTSMLGPVGLKVLLFFALPLGFLSGALVGAAPGWLLAVRSKWAPKPFWTAKYNGKALGGMLPPALSMVENGTEPELRTAQGIYEIALGREVELIVGRRKEGLKAVAIGALVVGLLAVMGVVFFTLMATQNPA